MKRIIYSSITKTVAFALFVASIVCGVLTATDGIAQMYGQEEQIYNFESDFSQTWYVTSLLDTPENLVLDIYRSVFYEDDGTGFFEPSNETMESNGKRVAFMRQLEEVFGNPYNFEKLNYYVKWNTLVFTNCDAEGAEDLMQGEYYSFLKRDAGGYYERRTSDEHILSRDYFFEEIARFDNTSEMIIGCTIREDALAEYKATWELQEAIVMNTIACVLICTVTALMMLIYLICVCGKTLGGEFKNIWFDNVWLEAHLAMLAAVGAFGGMLCLAVMEQFSYGDLPASLTYPAVGGISGFVSLVALASLLSIIRNIKTRRLLETSILLRVARWSFRQAGKIARWIWRQTKAFCTAIFGLISRKTGLILIGMLFVYTAVIGILGVFTVVSPVWLFVGILCFGLAAFVLAHRAKDIDEIKKGVSEVRNGNVAYKIPALKCEDLRTLGTDINHIAMGLDASVAARVKAERMKTELITNVSHDIKTPITSIISYSELLSKVEQLPQEAKDYVAVIARKSDRLKQLTQDLFDISKVQSGNEEVLLEKLDVALLVGQALAEQDSEIQSSGLTFCVDTPKEMYILADGRKLSRVLSNLLNNILKYTLQGTRVFITVGEKDGIVQLEMKNISAYPLNFSPEDITGRFVRGDESRTAEGNGLGLAIAKSYIEICNGIFDIVLDGDMFKAIMKFNKYFD